MKSKLLKFCECGILEKNIENFDIKPYVYISNIRFWAVNYRYHYTHEHDELSISRCFFSKFVVAIIDILFAFQRQVDFFNPHLIYPLAEKGFLKEKISLCWGLLSVANELNSAVPKYQLIKLLEFLILNLDIWENYVLSNGIDRFF